MVWITRNTHANVLNASQKKPHIERAPKIQEFCGTTKVSRPAIRGRTEVGVKDLQNVRMNDIHCANLLKEQFWEEPNARRDVRMTELYMVPPDWHDNPEMWHTKLPQLAKMTKRSSASTGQLNECASNYAMSSTAPPGSWAGNSAGRSTKSCKSCRCKCGSSAPAPADDEPLPPVEEVASPSDDATLLKEARLRKHEELYRTASLPTFQRKRGGAKSDGRPNLESFYNFSTMFKRPVRGCAGSFGSPGWGGTSGLGGRSK